jgi:hypothetical protein
MATNDQLRLIPLIQKAYGTGIEVNFDRTGRALNRMDQRNNEAKEKEKTQSASLYSIGADLDAKGWEVWSKQADELVKGLESGDIDYNSTEFAKEQAKLEVYAGAISEASKLRNDMQTQIQKDPDKFRYEKEKEIPIGEQSISGAQVTGLPQAGGAGSRGQGNNFEGQITTSVEMTPQEYKTVKYNAGLDGFRDSLSELNATEFSDVDSYISAMGSLGQNLKVMPYSSSQYETMMQKEADALNKGMFEGVVPTASAKSIGGGMTGVTTEYVAPEDRVKSSVEGLSASYGDYLMNRYSDGIVAGTIPPEMSYEEYAARNSANKLQTRKTDVSVRNTPSTYGRGSDKTDKEIIPSEDVIIDIETAQNNDDVEPVLKYVAGFGYDGRVEGDEFVFVKKVGLKDGEKEGSEHRVKISNTTGLYDFIGKQNPSVSRTALQSNERQPSPTRTVEQRNADLKAEKEKEAAIDKGVTDGVKILIGYNDSDEDSDEDFVDSVNKLEGVSYESELGRDVIVIDDERIILDPENEAKIKKKLREKGWVTPNMTSSTTKKPDPIKPSEKAKGL